MTGRRRPSRHISTYGSRKSPLAKAASTSARAKGLCIPPTAKTPGRLRQYDQNEEFASSTNWPSICAPMSHQINGAQGLFGTPLSVFSSSCGASSIRGAEYGKRYCCRRRTLPNVLPVPFSVRSKEENMAKHASILRPRLDKVKPQDR
ncbi:hypothetical protein GCM10010349_50000 [Streptomyces flavofungini]|nr:hypothetical protein GCM10010349_50000 [Streptomyces flavofungini]